MAIAVSLWFDSDLETRVRELWRELAATGVESSLYNGKYRPHITLGIWSIASVEELEADLRAWVVDQRRFEVEFRSVGLFPEGNGLACLQPLVTAPLLALQREAHSLASRLGATASPYFEPGSWVPHCTMAWEVSRERILEVADFLLRTPLPLKGNIAAIGVIETPAEVELRRFDLRPY